MQTLYVIIAFLSGAVLAFGALVFSIKPRCRQCDQHIARAAAGEAKAEIVTRHNSWLHKTNERLLLQIGVPALEKTPEQLQEEAEERREAEEREQKESQGGRTYGG